MGFVDHEKAFDSVEHWAVFHALHRCNIDSRYIDLFLELYSSVTLQVRLHRLINPVAIKKGVRLGEIISPKLFITVLEDIVKTLDWTKYGVNINGVCLSHLRFADNLVLFAENFNDLQRMLQQLYDDYEQVGLEMNMSNTRVMANISHAANTTVIVGCEKLEIVD